MKSKARGFDDVKLQTGRAIGEHDSVLVSDNDTFLYTKSRLHKVVTLQSLKCVLYIGPAFIMPGVSAH